MFYAKVNNIIISECFSAGVQAGYLVGKCPAVDGLILQLDIYQLVNQLWCVEAFHNLRSWRKLQLENKVGIKGL